MMTRSKLYLIRCRFCFLAPFLLRCNIAHGPKTNLKMSGRVLAFPVISYLKIEAAIFMFVTCKVSVKVFLNPVKIRPIRPIRPIRSNPVNFFWLIIRSCSGPVPAKIIPILSGSGSVRNFDPVAHCLCN